MEILLGIMLICLLFGYIASYLGIRKCKDWLVVLSLCSFAVFVVIAIIMSIIVLVGRKTEVAGQPETIVCSCTREIKPAMVQETYETPLVIPRLIFTPTPEPKPTTQNVIFEETEETEERYNFTERDIYLMARLLCGSKYIDGDGEYDFDYGNDDHYDQISLVLCVVMNRVRDDRFPNTVEEVILQKYPGQGYQFEPVAKWGNKACEVSDIAIQRVTEWCLAYNRGPMGSQTIPEDHVYFSSNGKGKNISRPGL